MERKCKRKEVCGSEKAAVSSSTDLEAISSLLRSCFPKSEDLHIVRHTISFSVSLQIFSVFKRIALSLSNI